MISASGRRLLTSAAWMLAVALAPALAIAQPAAAQKETARALVDAGRSKRSSGDLRGALTDFRAAHAIMKVPTTGLEVGKAEEQLGLLVEARDTLLEVARLPVEPREAPAFARAREQAKSLAESVAGRIPSLRLVLSGVPAGSSPKVSLDGADIVSETLGAPLKVNPGKHQIIARVGESARVIDIELEERASREMQVDLGAPKSLGPPARTNPLVFGGFGLAGAGLIVGSVTGILAARAYSTVAVQCPAGKCPPETHDDLASGTTLGTVSTISFVVAGVGAVAGVVGLLLPLGGSGGGSARGPAPSGQVSLASVWIGAGSAGVRGTF